MTALTADRVQLRERDLRQLSLPVAAGVLIYAGALVAINADAFAAPGTETAGLVGVGVAMAQADNSAGEDGDIKVEIRRGAYRFHNSGQGDAIGLADVGKTAWIVDDQTVALTDASGTRSPAGLIVDVDDNGVWIVFLAVGIPTSFGELVARLNARDGIQVVTGATTDDKVASIIAALVALGLIEEGDV